MIHKILEFGQSFQKRIFYVCGRGHEAHDHKVSNCNVISFSKLLPPGTLLVGRGDAISDEDLARVAGQFDELAGRYQPRTKQSPSLVFHAVISLDPSETLTKLEWQQVVEEYLGAIGFGDAQHLAVLHSDCEHEHVHIVANRVVLADKGYRLVSNSQDRQRGMAAMRRLEQRFNLSVVADPSNTWQVDYSPAEIRRAHATSTPPWRGQLLQLVAAAAESARNKSWAHFIESCEALSVSVSTRFDHQKNPVGVSFGFCGKVISGRKLKGSRCTFQKLCRVGGIQYEPARDFQAAEAANARHQAKSASTVDDAPQSTNLATIGGPAFMVHVVLDRSQLQRFERHQLTIYQSRYFEDRASIWLAFRIPARVNAVSSEYHGYSRINIEQIVYMVQLLIAILLGLFGVIVEVGSWKHVKNANPLDIGDFSQFRNDYVTYKSHAQKVLNVHGWAVRPAEFERGVQQSLIASGYTAKTRSNPLAAKSENFEDAYR